MSLLSLSMQLFGIHPLSELIVASWQMTTDVIFFAGMSLSDFCPYPLDLFICHGANGVIGVSMAIFIARKLSPLRNSAVCGPE
ncbi:MULTISPECIES: hypothetical protein [Serratia]|uniref:hypothetical protein n=1 Tax=Serratia TaxID=613 RepID=UPI0003A583A0|nr:MULTISPECIES: hypothetical protein [Serratia]